MMPDKSHVKLTKKGTAPRRPTADVLTEIHLFCSDDYRLRVESVSHALYEEVHSILHEDMEDLVIEGLIVPLFTPFGSDGRVDRQAFVEHLGWLNERGVRRIMVAGTTGEFFSLTNDERMELLKLSLEYFPGLILFHAGMGDLKSTQRAAKKAETLGADAVISLPPFYYADAPEQGVTTWFNALSETVDIPFMLYNFPRHTGVSITSHMAESVEHFGMKDSSANLSLIESTPRYFVGGDPYIVDAVRRGAAGYVSGVANAYPEVYVKMEGMLKDEEWDEVQKIQEDINGLVEPLEPSCSVAMLKEALRGRLKGYPVAVRPPLMTTEGKACCLLERSE